MARPEPSRLVRSPVWDRVIVLGAIVLAILAPMPVCGDDARDQAWRDDLLSYVEQLRKVHPKPFAYVAEARFDSAVAALDRRLPMLSDAEVAMGFMRLMAMLGDGHSVVLPTSRAIGFGRVIPVRLYAFEDGLFVSAATEAYADAVGAKVIRIGDLSADEALARVLEVSPADNDFTRLDRAPFFLTMPNVLQALGITRDSDRVSFEVRTTKGATHRFVANAVPDTTGGIDWFFEGEGLPVANYRTAHDGAKLPVPRHLRDPEKAWWYEWIPEQRMLYLQLRRVQIADQGMLFADFVRRMFAFGDSVRPDLMVIDLRHDHGGNNQILQPLIHGLVKRDSSYAAHRRLYTIIGRGTFSAAQNCANWLEEHTPTLFVGEPTGGRPNHFGDNEPVSLSHHPDLLVFVSRWAWQAQLPWDGRSWIAPHLAAPLMSKDYRENRDPALEAILAYRTEPTLAQLLRQKALVGEYGSAAAAYRAYKQRHPDRWGRTSEEEVTQLGYSLLGQGQTRAAVVVLKLNVESYPHSANAYDSLAEATLATGNKGRAIELYRKALELDPSLRSSRRMLEQLTRD